LQHPVDHLLDRDSREFNQEIAAIVIEVSEDECALANRSLMFY
jgi:hypothetical protein